jgi:hypothetical protein
MLYQTSSVSVITVDFVSSACLITVKFTITVWTHNTAVLYAPLYMYSASALGFRYSVVSFLYAHNLLRVLLGKCSKQGEGLKKRKQNVDQ